MKTPTHLIPLAVAAAAAAFIAGPAAAQTQFRWTPNAPSRIITPYECASAIRIFPDDADWTDATCHEIALTSSDATLNIHFRVGTGSRQVTITYVIPTSSAGRSRLPVIGVGISGTGIGPSTSDVIADADGKANYCAMTGAMIQCSAITESPNGRQIFAFINAARVQ